MLTLFRRKYSTQLAQGKVANVLERLSPYPFCDMFTYRRTARAEYILTLARNRDRDKLDRLLDLAPERELEFIIVLALNNCLPELLSLTLLRIQDFVCFRACNVFFAFFYSYASFKHLWPRKAGLIRRIIIKYCATMCINQRRANTLLSFSIERQDLQFLEIAVSFGANCQWVNNNATLLGDFCPIMQALAHRSYNCIFALLREKATVRVLPSEEPLVHVWQNRMQTEVPYFVFEMLEYADAMQVARPLLVDTALGLAHLDLPVLLVLEIFQYLRYTSSLLDLAFQWQIAKRVKQRALRARILESLKDLPLETNE